MKKNVIVSFLTLLITSYLIAGTTGKISGTITDGKSGEALPGVNVVVVGTSYGAVSDFEGNYNIINLSPGTYTVKVSAIGYSSVTMSNLKVNIDLTTRQDFKLNEETIQLTNEVVITADRALVQKDLTATTAVVSGDDIKQLPVTEIGQVIGLQAGSVDGKIRGGRSGEVAYWIDGVPVTDVYNGGTVVDVNPSMVQELQVLSGAFNAEYGQAMSGIVNISTREGSDKFAGSVTTYAGDFLSNRGDVFKGIQKFEPLNIRDIEGSISGPIISGDMSFALNARSIYFGGYLNAIRRFNPNTVGIKLSNGEFYIAGSDPKQDSIVVYNAMYANQKSNPDTLVKYFYPYYNSFRANNKNNTGDGKTVSMNWNKKLYLQGKIATKLSSMLKLNITGIYDDVESQPYNRYFQYNPDGQGKDYNKGYTAILQLTHTLNNSTFYTIGASYFEKSFKHYLYENPYDTRYVDASLSTAFDTYSFATGGNDLNRNYRSTTTGLLKADLSSQADNQHFIKTGVEIRQHRIFSENITLIPMDGQNYTLGLTPQYINTQFLGDSAAGHDRYVHMPTELSAYVQDKMEFKDLIINIGIRFDYFEPDANVLADDEDPYIYSPAKPGNIFFDYNGNGEQDPGEPFKTVADRSKYWYKKASAKYQISPRFGASFPITDRGVIHFSYGHFLQIPNFERLYQNPMFKIGAGNDNVDLNGTPTGNANLKPEQTINGEIGLQQQLSDDLSLEVTAYMRDIRNLTGTRADQIKIGGGTGVGRTYTKYVNSDFGFIRGFIISLDKRFAEGLSMTLDYTFQIARGTASDPNDSRNNVAGGKLPEVQLNPLGWDQRHTVNSVISYTGDSYGASAIARFGSGLPYTPRASSDVSVFLTNTGLKPTYYNVDTRFYKTFMLDQIRMMVFLRINNIFDIANETGVYDDTGRAGLTYDESRARSNHSASEYVNTLSDYYVNAEQYSEPRRIEFGVTVDF